MAGKDDKSRLLRNLLQAGLLGFAATVCMLASACLEKKDKCGDGMTVVEMPSLIDGGESQTFCTPKIVDTGVDTGIDRDSEEPSSDNLSDAGDGNDDTGNGDTDNGGLPSGMGEACEGEGKGTTCTGEADYCMEPPGYPGSCTVSDCTLSPDDCPEGYYCYDLSQFVTSLPTVCVPETK